MFRKKKDEDKEDEMEDYEGEDREENRRNDNIAPFRGADPFGDFFMDFGRIEEVMNELMKNMFDGVNFKGSFNAGKPFVYGFSMKTGPDGKPVFSEFGNVKQRGNEPIVSDAREPLVDVIDGKDEIIVVAELPGVEKKDIELEAASDVLTIRVDSAKRYYKEVPLPRKVKDGTTDASYKNGILEVKLKPVEEKKGGGKRIEIK